MQSVSALQQTTCRHNKVKLRRVLAEELFEQLSGSKVFTRKASGQVFWQTLSVPEI